MEYELRITWVLWYRVLRRRCWKWSFLHLFYIQFRKRRGVTALLPLQIVLNSNLTALVFISSAIGIYIVLHCDCDELSFPIPRRRSLYTDVSTITTPQIECDIFCIRNTVSPPPLCLWRWHGGVLGLSASTKIVIKNIFLLHWTFVT